MPFQLFSFVILNATVRSFLPNWISHWADMGSEEASTHWNSHHCSVNWLMKDMRGVGGVGAGLWRRGDEVIHCSLSYFSPGRLMGWLHACGDPRWCFVVSPASRSVKTGLLPSPGTYELYSLLLCKPQRKWRWMLLEGGKQLLFLTFS